MAGSAEPAPSARPLVLLSVEVSTSHAEALVRVTDPYWMRTSAVTGLAEKVIALLPGVIRHRCDCGSSHGIRAELADTETPHFVEHVALELMAMAGSPRELRGETTWDFSADGPGMFRVRIGFDDDLVALGALDRGTALVNALLLNAPTDPTRLVSELRGLRAR